MLTLITGDYWWVFSLRNLCKFPRSLDYKVMCEILLQRPFRWDSLGSLFSVRMNRDELQYMTDQARDEFDKVMTVLRQMPSSLYIVIR